MVYLSQGNNIDFLLSKCMLFKKYLCSIYFIEIIYKTIEMVADIPC